MQICYCTALDLINVLTKIIAHISAGRTVLIHSSLLCCLFATAMFYLACHEINELLALIQ